MSMLNCLYDKALHATKEECGCLPPFYTLGSLGPAAVCRGTNLSCAYRIFDDVVQSRPVGTARTCRAPCNDQVSEGREGKASERASVQCYLIRCSASGVMAKLPLDSMHGELIDLGFEKDRSSKDRRGAEAVNGQLAVYLSRWGDAKLHSRARPRHPPFHCQTLCSISLRERARGPSRGGERQQKRAEKSS